MGNQAAEVARVGVRLVDMHRGVVTGEFGVGQDAFAGNGVGGADAFIAFAGIVPVFFHHAHATTSARGSMASAWATHFAGNA
ncbi:hypothetical protein D3C76_1482550 [compost metagenome]